jgi:hypothetical protein
LSNRKENYPISAVAADSRQLIWNSIAGIKPARWPLNVLIVGDTTPVEFASCIAQITAATTVTYLPAAEDVKGFSCENEPDLIVLMAVRPGEYTDAAVERLRYVAPMARIVGLLGSWCEGEARTGHPWPAVPRIYWHRWQSWFDRELTLLAAGRCGTLSLPITAIEEERLLHLAAIPAAGSNATRRKIVLHSPSREMTAMLAEFCCSMGMETASFDDCDSDAAPTIGIFDIEACHEAALTELRHQAAKWPALRWILLMGFPRPEDHRRAKEAGAAIVVSKPLLLDELQGALAQIAGEPAPF